MTDKPDKPVKLLINMDSLCALGLLERSPDDPDMMRPTPDGLSMYLHLLAVHYACDKRAANELITRAKLAKP